MKRLLLAVLLTVGVLAAPAPAQAVVKCRVLSTSSVTTIQYAPDGTVAVVTIVATTTAKCRGKIVTTTRVARS